MREKFLTGLFVVLAIVLVLALLIVTNVAGFQHFMGEAHSAVVEVAVSAWAGIQILFWTALALAVSWFTLRTLRERKVIRPDKHGPAQAVIHHDKVIQLATSQAFLDPQQQLAYAKQILQAASAMGKASKQFEIEEERTVEANPTKQISAPSSLPTYVRYEDIASQIPRDHALVGIDGNGIVTRERAIKALIWIVGGSGSGKTNSACLRIQEDYDHGHSFLVIDPHWFKADSLWNAIQGYQDRFLVPIKGLEHPFASETTEITVWLDTFITEFKRRKAGGAWDFPITIIIEEIGSLVTDKTEDEDELAMREKIKTVTRICGQEGRNFEMTGMCVSQDAAGLSWLRKRAIMVIAHQLLMMSERELACNENKEIARSMDTWPIGRTLIYGIGFKEGQKVYQQPAFQPRIVDASPFAVSNSFLPGNTMETPMETASDGHPRKIIDNVFPSSLDEAPASVKNESLEVETWMRETVRRMKAAKESDRKIAKYVGLAGRKYHIYQQICRELGFTSELQAEGEA